MKKKLLLISILALLFSLTGCSMNEEEEKVYYKNVLVSTTKDVVSSYGFLSEAEANYYMNAGSDLEVSAVKGFQQIQTTDKVGEFVRFDTSGDNVKIEDGANDTILVSIICNYENRDVKVAVSYSENPEYRIYRDELYSLMQQDIEMYEMTELEYLTSVNNAYGYVYDPTSIEDWIAGFLYDSGTMPYIPEECEVTAIYSKKELIGQAAQNTAIGMITVFLVLVFISFIISLLKFVPRILGLEKKQKKETSLPKQEPAKPEVSTMKETAEKKEEPKQAVSDENLMNDAELVAVITAAIYAATGSNASTSYANAISKDKLIVRSIRRAR